MARSTPRVYRGGVLSDRDRAILDFERQWWKYAAAKEQTIRDLFDLSSTRYYLEFVCDGCRVDECVHHWSASRLVLSSQAIFL